MPACVLRVDGTRDRSTIPPTIDRTGPEAGSYLLNFSARDRRGKALTVHDRTCARVFPDAAAAKAVADQLPTLATSILPVGW